MCRAHISTYDDHYFMHHLSSPVSSGYWSKMGQASRVYKWPRVHFVTHFLSHWGRSNSAISTATSLLDTRTCSPFPGHVCAWWLFIHWLQPESESSWSSPKFLNCCCLTIHSRLWPSLLLVHAFLSHLPFSVLQQRTSGPYFAVEGVSEYFQDNYHISNLPRLWLELV